MNNFTPMMKQYYEIKNKYSDCIVFYRLGDFYEMFFEDAILVSKILDLALTKRDCGNNKKAPMCGIPHHVVNQYLYKLVSNGHKVAICEQVEDPKLVKGIVKREVIKIVSPGTIDEFDQISSKSNNYIMSIYIDFSNLGITYSDISTGEVFSTFILNESIEYIFNVLEEEITKINPSEIIYNSNLTLSIETKFVKLLKRFNIIFSKVKNEKNFASVKENNINFYNDNKSNQVCLYSVDLFYSYVCKFGVKLNHFKNIVKYNISNFLRIDANSRVNLELMKNNFSGDSKGALITVLDYTNTAMGYRKLSKWIEQPLIDKVKINHRLDLIDELYKNNEVKFELENLLKGISDIERINSKICFSNCNARDLINLKNSINNLPKIKMLLTNLGHTFKDLSNSIPDVSDIYNLIELSIMEDSGISIKEGNIIKKGYSEKLDKIRNNKVIGKKRIIEYEIEEKNNTGIKNLRLIYNKKTGYFFEVTKSYQNLVPEYFELKQTLTNSNRYKTKDLLLIEDMIFDSENEVIDLEYKLFMSIKNTISINIKKLQKASDLIALIDVIYSLSMVAYNNNYCRPVFNDEGIFDIKNGRHPVIESFLSNGDDFVVNNVNIGQNNNLIQIITGPNMSGKSTYIRQIALIAILAQMGSFVPANSANLSIVDKIFTRIGSSDNLYKGESTFMVEMKEVNNILRYATKDSLLILDEVGRGTSTYDGLSLAWAIIEYISSTIKAKTLFATHYHELIELENLYTNIKNKHILVIEDSENDNIVFLRKIVDGGADKSYGIAVAKMAGLPSSVITKSKQILNNIEKKEIDIVEDNNSNISYNYNFNDEIIDRLLNININNINPVESLNILNDLINLANSKRTGEKDEN